MANVIVTIIDMLLATVIASAVFVTFVGRDIIAWRAGRWWRRRRETRSQ